MHTDLRQLVGQFSQNPSACGIRMRSLLMADPDLFRRVALPLLKEYREDSGYNYLVTLLLKNGYLATALKDPDLMSLQEAVAVTNVASRVDRQFPVRLAEEIGVVTRAKVSSTDAMSDERLLEILTSIEDSSLILPLLNRLRRHPNPRIRSKAALLIVRGTRNSKLVEDHMAEEDPRVRANAVEALWHIDSEENRLLLWQFTEDAHNRVAGNALLGLYWMAEMGCVPLILEMASHPERDFRATAAWVMGQTEDPRFLETLNRMLAEKDPRVRSNCVRAIARIRQCVAKVAAAGRLDARFSLVHTLPDGCRQVWVSVADAEAKPVEGLASTRVALWEDAVLISDYSFEERRRQETQVLGFAFPRNSAASESLAQVCQQALQACLLRKRKGDLWAVVRYKPVGQGGGSASPEEGAGAETPVSVSQDPELIQKSLNNSGTRDLSPEGILETVRRLLAAMDTKSGEKSIVVLAPPDESSVYFPPHAQQLVQEVVFGLSQTKAAFYAAVLPNCPPETTRILSGIAELTGGAVLPVISEEKLPQMLEAFCVSLAHRYNITYLPSNGGAPPGASRPQRILVQVTSSQGCGEAVFPP